MTDSIALLIQFLPLFQQEYGKTHPFTMQITSLIIRFGGQEGMQVVRTGISNNLATAAPAKTQGNPGRRSGIQAFGPSNVAHDTGIIVRQKSVQRDLINDAALRGKLKPVQQPAQQPAAPVQQAKKEIPLVPVEPVIKFDKEALKKKFEEIFAAAGFTADGETNAGEQVENVSMAAEIEITSEIPAGEQAETETEETAFAEAETAEVAEVAKQADTFLTDDELKDFKGPEALTAKILATRYGMIRMTATLRRLNVEVDPQWTDLQCVARIKKLLKG